GRSRHADAASAGRRCKLPTTTTASARKCRPSSDLLSASALATTAAPDGKHLANNDGSGRMLRSADESQCWAAAPSILRRTRPTAAPSMTTSGSRRRWPSRNWQPTDRKIFAHCFLRVSVGDFGGPEHALNSLGRLKQLRSGFESPYRNCDCSVRGCQTQRALFNQRRRCGGPSRRFRAAAQ
uniref:Os06g0641700 protein n=1 Tax=Macrostomum lignano TaxID=282301 RepID=A0A1I8FLE1_9PLAT